LPGSGPAARLTLLGLVTAIGLISYLDVRPVQPWILWLTAGLVALAADGIVRGNANWTNGSGLASVVYVFLPALAALGAGLFIDDAIGGYGRPFAAVAAAALVAVVAWGEYHTVDFSSSLYGSMRLLLAIATYLTAFALYTVIFTRGLELPMASLCVALVSLALSAELLRESHLSGASSLLVGLAIGVSVGELRLVLYFFALDGLLAGAILIIAFYLATGLVHHLLDHDLEWSTTAEYLLVAAVGTAAVVFTRAFV
jgi:Protein of unknown function (DUF5656)